MSEKSINCLIIVDTEATVNGTTTVYMVDDNGDASQGSSELTINCEVGDTINFNVASIIPTWGCALTGLTYNSGQAVLFRPGFKNGVWTGTVEQKGNMQYSFTFTISPSSTQYTWDPFITVT